VVASGRWPAAVALRRVVGGSSVEVASEGGNIGEAARRGVSGRLLGVAVLWRRSGTALAERCPGPAVPGRAQPRRGGG
jgi:hypothetical protein